MRLSDSRYEEIKQTIADFLEDYNVSKLPVDVFDLAEKLGIRIVRATELIKKNKGQIDENFIFTLPNSFLHVDNQAQKIIIYLDDVGTKRNRQRFSIAHEILHIILEHTEQTPRNESEANFGAIYLLAPTSLVLIPESLNYLDDFVFVQRVFGVSEQTADIAVRYNLNRLLCLSSKPKKYEITINSLFKDSLISHVNKHDC